MSISTPTAMPVPATGAPATAPAAKAPRFPHVPARVGNANVRALLAQGVHPASGQPLTDTPGTDCGSCALAYRIQLPNRDGKGNDGGSVREHLKCSKAPISRRGHQGVDLRPASDDVPGTPACTLHCRFTDWPLDPDGFDQTADDSIGTGRDHADDRGVYAVYRIFGIDPEYQRAWVELEAEMVPYAAAPSGYIARAPEPQGSAVKPHLYRFWTRLSRLHTAHLTHRADTGDCTHALVRTGRVLLAPPSL
ncbi:hypothetical protein ACPXCO_24180 [Streptomyces cyaneofuscatus]|uniref:hypothetical protein n=1 Tax=Streptomyces cyaneofuscatus TaxID=66883 RepID=UPI003CEADB76